MLYAPMLAAFAVSPATYWWGYAALALSAFALMFLREAVSYAQCKHWRRRDTTWVIVYGLAVSAFAVPLMVTGWGPELAVPAMFAGLIFSVHTGLSALPFRKRFDRSTAGEILGASAASLSAPAATVVACGHCTVEGWILAGVFWAYFSGRILHVNMLLDAAKYRRDFTCDVASKVATPLSVYMVALGVILLVGISQPSIRIWSLVGTAAVAPSTISSLIAQRHLGDRVPSLKRVGLQETIFAIWVASVIIFAHIVGHSL
jgi:hypothetical protein